MAQFSSISTDLSSDHGCTPRRRQLFPTTDDDDDLGHISPLSNTTPPDSPLHLPVYAEYKVTNHNTSNFNKSTIADYVILANINDVNKKDSEKPLDDEEDLVQNRTPICNRLQIENSMSPLYLSPVQTLFQSSVISSPKKYKQKSDDDTPSRKSSIQTLKTPQDCYSVNTNVPKLIRKFSLDGCSSGLEFGKRKMPFSESPPSNKQPKLDPGSKVRTVLFPKPEKSLATSSFYSKPGNASLERFLKNSSINTKKIKTKSPALYLCGRKTSKNRFGEINAGVRHKIRRPRPKKIATVQHLKAALNIIDNSPLNDYLNDVKNMSALNLKQQQQRTSRSDEALVPYSYIIESPHKKDRDNDEFEKMLEEKTDSRKRQLSPPPDPTKKFFKFKRSNAVVTVDKHLKLKVDNGKLSLLETKKTSKKQATKQKINLDLADLTVPENENLISPDKIDEILFNLDNNDKENEVISIQTTNVNTEVSEYTEQFVLEAHNSVTMSENSIHLHISSDIQRNKDSEDSIKPTNEKNILLSPTSQMCNMTSGLALNSPKKSKLNINNILNDNANMLDETSCSALDMEQKKLFPIFYGTQNTPSNSSKNPKNTLNSKKYKLLPKNQMLLDAGQKRFGVTQCHECKFVYHMGDPNEESLHLNYHNAGNIFRFNGWKDERMIAQFPNGKIIKVVPTDPKPWIKKVKELLEVINRELGYYDMSFSLDNTQVYLYVKNKTIVGCLTAEARSRGYRMLSDNVGIDLCSEESYLIKCGVNRIWVSQLYRKEGISTALMNSLRGNFMFGSILNKEDIAFSSPTEAGKAFATKYFKTPNFLIYM